MADCMRSRTPLVRSLLKFDEPRTGHSHHACWFLQSSALRSAYYQPRAASHESEGVRARIVQRVMLAAMHSDVLRHAFGIDL